MNWPAIAAARAHEPARRLPFFIGGHLVGSVARVHLGTLRDWPQALRVETAAVRLVATEPTAVLAAINAALREQGLVRGWRDEAFAIFSLDDGSRLARTERAAARFWGTLTLGAHATGYVRGDDGRPAALWLAQRSPSKATDPGMYDNLVGGGVAAGQTPAQALVREGWEEAGLEAPLMHTARAGAVLRLHRDIHEGLQNERLHAYDLELPHEAHPDNQDGEVAGFTLMSVPDALALAAGTAMTVDAALVTIDFALRHGLLDDAEAARRLQALRVARYA
jgi:8-oxo-dGTP pyrophosphatase MutT (NUDIX family)